MCAYTAHKVSTKEKLLDGKMLLSHRRERVTYVNHTVKTRIVVYADILTYCYYLAFTRIMKEIVNRYVPIFEAYVFYTCDIVKTTHFTSLCNIYS